MARPIKARNEGPTRVRAERKKKTRARVLEAAEALFMEKGYFDTRAGDIAEAAGVAHGTVFAHFGSKAGLILQLLQDFSRNRRTELEELRGQAQAHGATAEDEFWEVIRANWASDLERLGLIRAYASYSWVWDAELETAHAELRALNRDYIASILERAGLNLPEDGLSLAERVALFFAVYREMLRTYSPQKEAERWAEIERTANFLFPFPKPGRR